MRPTNSSRRNRGRNNSGRRNGSGFNQGFDSNGIENKLKGNAIQVHEKYLSLARDANSSGDTIKAESPTVAAATCRSPPVTTPNADTTPAQEPCCMLRPTIYRTAGPGITRKTREVETNKRKL